MPAPFLFCQTILLANLFFEPNPILASANCAGSFSNYCVKNWSFLEYSRNNLCKTLTFLNIPESQRCVFLLQRCDIISSRTFAFLFRTLAILWSVPASIYGTFRPLHATDSSILKTFVFVFKQLDSCYFVVLKPMGITAKT